jgi:hypothetical protein
VPPPPSSPPKAWRAFAFAVILVAVVSAFFNSPTARAVVMGCLLVLMLVVWLVRPAQPSGAFLDLLAVLIGASVFLTVLAIPLPSALYLPQLAVGVVLQAFVVVRAMRRIAP